MRPSNFSSGLNVHMHYIRKNQYSAYLSGDEETVSFNDRRAQEINTSRQYMLSSQFWNQNLFQDGAIELPRKPNFWNKPVLSNSTSELQYL